MSGGMEKGTHSFLVAALCCLDLDLNLPIDLLCASDLGVEFESQSLLRQGLLERFTGEAARC